MSDMVLISREDLQQTLSWLHSTADHDRRCDLIRDPHKPCSCGLSVVFSALRKALAQQAQQEPQYGIDVITALCERLEQRAQQTPEEIREAFEDWFSNGGQWTAAAERNGDGYKMLSAENAWRAWQAARGIKEQL